MIILILIIFIAILLAAYLFDVTGMKSSDRSQVKIVLSVLGVTTIVVAIFAELLHATGIIKIYIGDLFPLGDNTVPTLYFIGVGLVLFSTLFSKNKALNIGNAIGFCAVSGAIGFIGFILIALSAI